MNSLPQAIFQQKMHESHAFLTSELFRDVQLERVFPDGKTFADAILKAPWSEIEKAYQQRRAKQGFALESFVNEFFDIPPCVDYQEVEAAEQAKGSVRHYIEQLWAVLQRAPDQCRADSLLPLNSDYIVPGGRFREVYYWDSYFTGLGLIESGRNDLLLSMLRNFIELQQTVGCIPNGNRSYYHTRSQPPVLALIIELLLEHETFTPDFMQFCLEGLETEYLFWMQGQDNLKTGAESYKRVVSMPGGEILNRYWDDSDGPRPESYREDIELAEQLAESEKGRFFRNIRAACESGWDFSSRWLADVNDLASIRTTEIVPVDLNCLLYKLESLLAELHTRSGNHEQADTYHGSAQARANAIQKYLWDERAGWFFDYDIQNSTCSSVCSLAGILPMYVGIARESQGKLMCEILMEQFLKEGGLITTLLNTEQQWDSPNGWAPLHWFAVKALQDYGYRQHARCIMQLWVFTVEHHFEDSGHLMEKYNVVAPEVIATGGEYEVQHGFGWTNGVTMTFYRMLEETF